MIRAVLFDLDGTLLDRDATVQCLFETQYNRIIAIVEKLTHVCGTLVPTCGAGPVPLIITPCALSKRR
jgi:hypothetical protein